MIGSDVMCEQKVEDGLKEGWRKVQQVVERV
jgi:hypothetical protein